jgi:hypothetical protein
MGESIASHLPRPLGVDDHTSAKYRADPYSPNALLGDWVHDLLSLRERAMLWFMNEVTDLPRWTALVTDEAAIERWRTQFVAGKRQSRTTTPFPALPKYLAATGFTDRMLDVCITELRAKATNCARQGHNMVRVLDSDAGVYKRALPELVGAVQAALAPLEAEAREEGQYRADHGYAMFHVADVNMYPIEYGRTCALAEPVLTRANCIGAIGTGDTLPFVKTPKTVLDRRQVEGAHSQRFAWLPTDVEIVDGHPRLVGYLNNIHPEHTAVYTAIEDVLYAALPMFVAATEQVRLGRRNITWSRTYRPLNRERRIPWVEMGAIFECQSADGRFGASVAEGSLPQASATHR